jgi:hypothetical protein
MTLSVVDNSDYNRRHTASDPFLRPQETSPKDHVKYVEMPSTPSANTNAQSELSTHTSP